MGWYNNFLTPHNEAENHFDYSISLTFIRFCFSYLPPIKWMKALSCTVLVWKMKIFKILEINKVITGFYPRIKGPPLNSKKTQFWIQSVSLQKLIIYWLINSKNRLFGKNKQTIKQKKKQKKLRKLPGLCSCTPKGGLTEHFQCTNRGSSLKLSLESKNGGQTNSLDKSLHLISGQKKLIFTCQCK